MRKNTCSWTQLAGETGSLALRVIWDVTAGASYDVVRRQPAPGARLIAVRTRRGRGKLYLTGRPQPFELGPNSLLVVENAAISRYHTRRAPWVFWWFEFELSGVIHIPLNEVMTVKPQPGDNSCFRAVFAGLRSNEAAQQRLMSASFAVLFYRWIAQWQTGLRRWPHQAQIEQAIRRMHAHLQSPLDMRVLASEIGMSDRMFRACFRRATGLAPKRFYNNLRVRLGFELMRTEGLSVKETADRLGFSSPFHFDKEFKKHFGLSPSEMLDRSAVQAGVTR